MPTHQGLGVSGQVEAAHFFLSELSVSGGMPTTVTVPCSMLSGAAITRGSSLQRRFFVCGERGPLGHITVVLSTEGGAGCPAPRTSDSVGYSKASSDAVTRAHASFHLVFRFSASSYLLLTPLSTLALQGSALAFLRSPPQGL